MAAKSNYSNIPELKTPHRTVVKAEFISRPKPIRPQYSNGIIENNCEHERSYRVRKYLEGIIVTYKVKCTYSDGSTEILTGNEEVGLSYISSDFNRSCNIGHQNESNTSPEFGRSPVEKSVEKRLLGRFLRMFDWKSIDPKLVCEKGPLPPVVRQLKTPDDE